MFHVNSVSQPVVQDPYVWVSALQEMLRIVSVLIRRKHLKVIAFCSHYFVFAVRCMI